MAKKKSLYWLNKIYFLKMTIQGKNCPGYIYIQGKFTLGNVSKGKINLIFAVLLLSAFVVNHALLCRLLSSENLPV